jgi:F-type H+-transporting ATPase subunit gamma
MSKVIEIRNQLGSIGRLNAMTQAMQVVAVAQLRHAQSRQAAANHWRRHFDRLVGRLGLTAVHPTPRPDATNLLFVVGSERGFCGDFNDKLVAQSRIFLREQRAQKFNIKILGRRGSEKFPTAVKLAAADFLPAIEKAYQSYLAGEVASVYVLYNEFKSMLTQTSKIMRILPFAKVSDESESDSNLICEPTLAEVRQALTGYYLKSLCQDVFMQASLGEVASRLLTMRSATENSRDMINTLRIKLNKARQSMITFELTEIVSSFETLRDE